MRNRQRIDKRSGKNYSKTIKLYANGNKFWSFRILFISAGLHADLSTWFCTENAISNYMYPKKRANISVGEEFSCLGTVVLPRTLQESWSQGIHAVIYKCKVINCIKTLYCIFILQGHVELTLKFMISTTINLIDISV